MGSDQFHKDIRLTLENIEGLLTRLPMNFLMHSLLGLFVIPFLLEAACALPSNTDSLRKSHDDSLTSSIERSVNLWPTLSTPKSAFSCFDTAEFPHVTFADCSATLNTLLRKPGSFVTHHYEGTTTKPAYLTKGACTIILGTRRSGTEIDLSIQQIVSFVRDILTACRNDMRGGIRHVDSTWYVALRGERRTPGQGRVMEILQPSSTDFDNSSDIAHS